VISLWPIMELLFVECTCHPDMDTDFLLLFCKASAHSLIYDDF
jgi:hypothetical protein